MPPAIISQRVRLSFWKPHHGQRPVLFVPVKTRLSAAGLLHRSLRQLVGRLNSFRNDHAWPTVVDSNPRLGSSQEDPGHGQCRLACEETNCRIAGMSSFFSNRSCSENTLRRLARRFTPAVVRPDSPDFQCGGPLFGLWRLCCVRQNSSLLVRGTPRHFSRASRR
jgi:hypothetical protein